MTIEETYQILCATPSDINLHLPTLRKYADRCDTVCEMGVRSCVSLHAFLASNAKRVTAYDILDVSVPASEKLTFHCADVLFENIALTDMLFIDTLHTYAQLRQELAWHSPKVRRYIAMHDTNIFGTCGEDGGRGLNAAISEFLAEHPEWKEIYRTDANNGLTILERV